MNLFFHELRENRSSTISWTISLTLVAVAFIAMFPIFQKDAAGMQEVLATLPPVVRSALGLQVNSLFTILGYYSYFLTFIVLTGAIQAMNLGVYVIAKEGTLKTSDFLLSKPITRFTILNSKLAASLVSIFMTNSVFVGSTTIFTKLFIHDTFSAKTFIALSGILLLVQLFFLALGFLISAILKKVKSPSAISLPVVFSFFIISMLDSILGVENVRYATPFKFFDPTFVIKHNCYEPGFLLLEFFLVSIAVFTSYLIYNKRDIDAVA